MEIQLKTIDGEILSFNGPNLVKSLLFKSLLSLPQTETPLEIPIRKEIISIIFKFMEVDNSVLSPNYNPLDIKFKSEDSDFFIEYSSNTLVEICNASNYLNYPYLLELTCKLIAIKLQYKDTEELREFIGIENLPIDEEGEDRQFDWLSSSE